MSADRWNAARWYVRQRNWPIIPLEPAIRGDDASGKSPMIQWRDRVTTTIEEVDEWARKWPEANLGLPLGRAVGLWVLDIDPRKGGQETLEALEVDHGALHTAEVRTGGDGRHLYFTYPNDRGVFNSAGKVGPGIDVRGHGGQVVLPPSAHWSGGSYGWVWQDFEPVAAPEWLLDLVSPRDTRQAKIFELPQGVSFPRRYAAKALERADREMRDVTSGERNETLFRLAAGFREMIEAGWILRDDVEAVLDAAADSHPDSKLHTKPRSRHKTLQSGLGDAYCAELVPDIQVHHEASAKSPDTVKNPGAYGRASLTGLCDAVEGLESLKTAAGKVRDLVERGWVTRDKAETALFAAAESVGLAAADARQAIGEALGDVDEGGADGGMLVPNEPTDWAEKVVKMTYTLDDEPTIVRWRGAFWTYCPKRGGYREEPDEAVEVAIWRALHQLYIAGAKGPKRLVANETKVRNTFKAMRGIVPRVDDKAQAPCWLDGSEFDRTRYVCTPSGTYDLRTHEITPATPRLLSIHPFDVRLAERARGCLRWENFLAETFGDIETIECLQEWFGYLLTPDTSQQKMLLILGQPRSGKGTIGRVLRHLMGDNMIASSMSAIMGDFGLMHFPEKLAAIFPDAEFPTRGRGLAELLKSITGQDPVLVNRKQKSALTLELDVRLFVLTNKTPRIPESSGALASRFVVLETEGSRAGREDPKLEAKLLEEMPGIFQWAVVGWHRLRNRGRFVQPSRSAHVIEDMRLINNPVAQFVADGCLTGDGVECDPDYLYEKYIDWIEEQRRGNSKLTALRQSALREELKSLGFCRVGKKKRTRDYPRPDQRSRYYPWIGLRPMSAEERLDSTG